MTESRKPPPNRRALQRSRSNFLTRTATDTAAQLDRRFSTMDEQQPLLKPQPHTNASKPISDGRGSTKKAFGSPDGINDAPIPIRRTSSGRQRSSHGILGDTSLTANMHKLSRNKSQEDTVPTPRIGSLPRPVGGHEKLGTFSGVFVPTTLNVLSILMFLRFGFILGQSGLLGMMGLAGLTFFDVFLLGMLVASYIINLVTTLSISAIATNGTVRGGGAYYLISRSLGPEFGGSIGIVLYLGFVFNTGLNAVGLIDCLKQNFGETSGGWLPESFWWEYLWATIVLVICTGICLAGSGIFARCSNGLLAILLVATFSIPFSIFVVKPFESRSLGIEYTGISLETLKGNLFPRFTRGAAGSQLKEKENLRDLFGILFPATGGIFAGASMSGDLKYPSKAIPKGTLSGLGLTFIAYTGVILAMAASITRPSFYRNVNVIQDTNISSGLVLLGEFATSFFSSLMGVIGSAKLLQALGRDHLLPGFSIFGQGTKSNDEPTYAIIITHIVAQLTMLCDINQIASFVTMSYLITFLVTNLACFLLKISSAPNFRPSFHYFNWWTAAFGTLVSGASMFFVDGLYATGSVAIVIVIFLIIHYTSPPKSWGDVSQSLIYHQVRKYLLRLRPEHVKFWRPQILLLVNDPRHQYKLIQFCNSLKKGGLFVLGHVIVTSDFGNAVPEARQQQSAWTKYIDFSKIKAFVNIAISPAVEWGVRDIVLGSGLGGMRPNIVIMGFYNLNELRQAQPLIDVPSPQHSRNVSTAANSHIPRRASEPYSDRLRSSMDRQSSSKFRRRDSKAEKLRGLLPTDNCRTEPPVGITSYVTMLEDLLLKLQINVAVAKGFKDLEFPEPKGENSKKYIDLWPIQMSAEIEADGGEEKQNLLTTNFDTYTLILQLGCILDTVPRWKKVYKLRVAVFVEYESDVEEERERVKTLLDNLRIQAEVLVFWLASGDLSTYQVIVNGADSVAAREAEEEVNEVLQSEEWWGDVRRLRRKRDDSMTESQELADAQGLLDATPEWPSPSFQHGRRQERLERFEGLQQLLHNSKRRHSISGLKHLGVSLGMRTHRLHDDLVHHHAAHGSASEESSSSETSEDETPSQERASIASADDLAGFESDTDLHVSRTRSPTKPLRRRSDGDSLKDAVPFDLAKLRQAAPTRSDSVVAPDVQVSAVASDTDLLDTAVRPEHKENQKLTAPTDTSQATQSLGKNTPSAPPSRPRPVRQASAAKFTSNPTPATTIATTEDGPGPSIMFTDTESTPKALPHQSIYNRQASNDSRPGAPQNAAAGGFPFQQSVPLSFNDLPCRAQHLILNELIQEHSQDTAVIFTTLPSPIEGTCKSEEDSISYLSDLEVLCQDLPPVLLVHSNSMTVTMNL